MRKSLSADLTRQSFPEPFCLGLKFPSLSTLGMLRYVMKRNYICFWQKLYLMLAKVYLMTYVYSELSCWNNHETFFWNLLYQFLFRFGKCYLLGFKFRNFDFWNTNDAKKGLGFINDKNWNYLKKLIKLNSYCAVLHLIPNGRQPALRKNTL